MKSENEYIEICCDTHEKGTYGLFRLNHTSYYLIEKNGEPEKAHIVEATHDEEAMELYAEHIEQDGNSHVCPKCGAETEMVPWCNEHGGILND